MKQLICNGDLVSASKMPRLSMDCYEQLSYLHNCTLTLFVNLTKNIQYICVIHVGPNFSSAVIVYTCDPIYPKLKGLKMHELGSHLIGSVFKKHFTVLKSIKLLVYQYTVSQFSLIIKATAKIRKIELCVHNGNFLHWGHRVH